jgi:hypothetical protein
MKHHVTHHVKNHPQDCVCSGCKTETLWEEYHTRIVYADQGEELTKPKIETSIRQFHLMRDGTVRVFNPLIGQWLTEEEQVREEVTILSGDLGVITFKEPFEPRNNYDTAAQREATLKEQAKRLNDLNDIVQKLNSYTIATYIEHATTKLPNKTVHTFAISLYEEKEKWESNLPFMRGQTVRLKGTEFIGRVESIDVNFTTVKFDTISKFPAQYYNTMLEAV